MAAVTVHSLEERVADDGREQRTRRGIAPNEGDRTDRPGPGDQGQGHSAAAATTVSGDPRSRRGLVRGLPVKYFDDLDVGLVLWGDEVTVDRDEMITFAQRFDPQPMHLTDASAQAIGLDAVIASGSFTWALSALSIQGMVREGLALLPGGLKMEISFTAPVVSGDRLRLRAEVADLRASSKGERGYARMSQRFLNQGDVAAMEIDATWVIATRPDNG